jgi:hypothetical protein
MKPPATPNVRSKAKEGAELKAAEAKGKAGDPRGMDRKK